MRIAITGASGQLGRELVPLVKLRGHLAIPLSRSELDVTRFAAVAAAFALAKPDVVIHAAAYTSVDAAEAEPGTAFAVNQDGTRHVAQVCLGAGIPLVFISTDYVFDGESRVPYRPDDPPHALNAYGASKLAGERCVQDSGVAHLIVRTSWLYGAHGSNFVKTILQLAQERPRLEVVDDQYGSPTWTGTLAEALVDLTTSGARGVMHVSDRTADDCGPLGISWCEFARAILADARLVSSVAAVPTSAFPRPARRPAYSVLDLEATEKWLGRRLPHWRVSLRRMLGQAQSPDLGSMPLGRRHRSTGSHS
jgi:dTDP-4-dehydrorhamnose reductase